MLLLGMLIDYWFFDFIKSFYRFVFQKSIIITEIVLGGDDQFA